MSQWMIPQRFDIRGVVFDMDGLMVDTERVIKYSWDVTGEKLGYEKFGDNILNTLGKNRVQRNQYFLEKYGEDFPLQSFLDGYHQVYYEYEKKNGIPKKKGLMELLNLLKERDIPMAVATSTYKEHTVPELEKQGILSYFQEIITGDMVTNGKPDPEIYRKACQRLHILPQEAIALEDSYNGVRSAWNAGMKVIMIPDLLEDDGPVKECLYGKMKSLSMVCRWIKDEI
ncbi:MAG: HAD family phosphatase [Clostridia bacterium]|nr:HAD family phosphatase [Clostridia bacterium]NCC44787.1 HAD family phosphatase [Clostridia bacterium]